MNENDVRERVKEEKSALLRSRSDWGRRFAELNDSIATEINEIMDISGSGKSPVPAVNYADIAADGPGDDICDLVRRRGCVVVRGVFAATQAAEWNEELGRYVTDNGYYEQELKKRGMDTYFGSLADGKPQIFGIYWSQPQVMARQSEQLATTRRWLNRLWDVGDEFNPDLECTYADRIRRREPGDATLGLSPHVDGGSVERWIDPGFRQVYRHVLEGDWRDYNPFAAAGRTTTKEIPSPAVCRMFRTYQGWTALTPQGSGDGTLQLVPVARAMAWILLRAMQDDIAADDLCDASGGKALALTEQYHAPLLRGLTPIPHMNAGDTVWWHPEVIHAVENEHHGSGYSNVMYIGAAPDCDKNRAFLKEQLPCFMEGRSSPDFAPENYEVDYDGRAALQNLTPLGRRQMGAPA